MLSKLLPLAALPLAAQALIEFPMDNRMVQQPGLLRYPISVTSGAPAKDKVFRRQDEVGVVSQKSGFFYSIELQIGTPPQAVSVNFDTGSSELWVNPVCKKSTNEAFCQTFGRFNGSQTFVDTGSTNKLYYGTGYADLRYGYDYVQIGSAKISQQMFGVATDSEFAVTGIMGAGPSLHGWDNSYPLIIDNLAKQGFTNSRAFSLDIRSIESQRGSVVFGGIDTMKFSGKLEKRPIIPAAQSPDGQTRYWVFLDGISVTKDDGSEVTISDKPNGQPVLLDSGYTISSVSTELFNKIKDAFPNVTPPPADDKSGLYRISCNVGDTKGHINFKFGETTINVPFNDFIWKQPDVGICVLGVVPDDEFPVLGDTFLRAAYVVYDWDNRNIHLANNEDCGSKLVAIGKGPDAVPNIEGECGKPQPTTTTTTAVSSTSATSSSVATSSSAATSSEATTSSTSISSSGPITNETTTALGSTTSAAPATTTTTTEAPVSNSTMITSKAATESSSIPTGIWNSTAPPTYTSTFTTTSLHTVTSCPPYVTGCPIGSVTTETIIGTTTWCPGPDESSAPATTPPPVTSAASITSIVTTTKTYTITSCPGEGSCNKGHVTTEVLTSTTYLCPESTATFTIPRVHTCQKGESGCNPGDKSTTIHTVTIHPITTATMPTPIPGCTGDCVVPPPAPTQPAQTSAVETMPSFTAPGTISGITTMPKPTETAPCSTCGPQTSAPAVTAGAAMSRVPVLAAAMILGAVVAVVA